MIAPTQAKFSAPLPSALDIEEKYKQQSMVISATQSAAFLVSTVIAAMATQGTMGSEKIQGVPPLPEPVAELDTPKLEKQAYDIAARFQNKLWQFENTTQAQSSQTDDVQPASGINFAAVKVPETGTSPAINDAKAHAQNASADAAPPPRSKATGIMDGRLSQLMALITQIIDAEAKNKTAEMFNSTGNAELSFGLSKLAANEEIRSGNARRDELITSGVSTLTMTVGGTVTANKGIKQQKQALKIHGANEHQLRGKAMEMNHALAAKPLTGVKTTPANGAAVKTPVAAGQTSSPGTEEMAGTTTGSAAGSTAHAPEINAGASGKRFVDDDAVRYERDRQVLSKTPQDLQLRAEAERMAGEDIRLTGQRTTQHGHAVTSSAGALGGIAGSQFGVESSQAQAAKQLADGGSRVMDSSSAQQMKQVEAAYALITALLQMMQQVASANTEAASAVAQNMRA